MDSFAGLIFLSRNRCKSYYISYCSD